MRNRFFIIIISIALIFNMTFGGVCAAQQVKAGTHACETKRLSENGTSKTIPETCRMTPCRHQKGRTFIFPEAFSQRSHDPKRGYFSSPAITVGMQADAASVSFQIGIFPLKLPPPFSLPPLFSLHCAYLC
jgi:hypothetical protein